MASGFRGGLGRRTLRRSALAARSPRRFRRAARPVFRFLLPDFRNALSQRNFEPLLWPRLAGSWPGVTFTGAPLKLPAGQFGLGHGAGAHAPNEYWLIESANPKVAGMDGAAKSFVEFFYACA
jgi:hypothetical protein